MVSVVAIGDWDSMVDRKVGLLGCWRHDGAIEVINLEAVSSAS
jgi:hypothetical protein